MDEAPFGTAVGRLSSAVLALFVAVGFAVAGIGGGSLLGFGLERLLSRLGVELSVVASTVLSTLLLQGVTFGGLTALYLAYRRVGIEYVGLRRPDLEEWMYAGAGYVLAFVVAIATIFVVVFLLELTPARNRAAELGQQDPRLFLVLVVLAFVLIAPGEELLFRGVIQTRLRETFSAAPAVAVATAIFAVVHAPALAGSTGGRAVTVVVLFFPGLVFGVIYERTGNLVVPILVHGAYNATLFSLAYLSIAFG